MRERLSVFFQSLGFRLLVPLFLIGGAVLSVHAVVSFRSTKDDFLSFARGNVDRTSELIKRATHDGMLLNRKIDVLAMLAQLAEGPEIAAIRVYDQEGRIVMSAREEEIGNRIARDSDTCLSCHPRSDPQEFVGLKRRHVANVGHEPQVLRHLSVIENSPACATAACHAHPADQRVLGILDLEMSMAPLDEAIRTSQAQFLWTTLILTVVVGVVVAVVIRRLVQRPVDQLSEGTRRIADGDLATRIQVGGRHELARLAAAFNHMAGDLQAARLEVTQWSQRLEEKVVEKTEELSRVQRQVLHMEKMASLGKLSATVAHEINNPISGVLVYARLVRRELAEQPIQAPIREELARYLNLIEKECTRCGAIVRNLLVFARRTGAQMTLVDLNDVIERSIMLVRHHLEISGLTLHSELLSDDSRVVADAGQIEQAMVALLVNAVEAMKGLEPGAGHLTVKAFGRGDQVQIDVADTGSGISADVLPQIFEPFFSTKEAENGVGLGLAVVYGIVQRHGGQIEVESQVGRGTVFHLRIPRNLALPEDEPPPAALAILGGAERIAGQGETA